MNNDNSIHILVSLLSNKFERRFKKLKGKRNKKFKKKRKEKKKRRRKEKKRKKLCNFERFQKFELKFDQMISWAHL